MAGSGDERQMNGAFRTGSMPLGYPLRTLYLNFPGVIHPGVARRVATPVFFSAALLTPPTA